MTLYDLLRALVNHAPLSADLLRELHQVLDEHERNVPPSPKSESDQPPAGMAPVIPPEGA